MYRITAVIMSIMISATSMMYSVFVPTLPYVPPADVQIFGWLNNLYGMTAISEGTETEKLQAYWDMYRAIMGSAFDTFQTQMQDLLDGAKTGRKMVITPTLNSTINQALKNAMQNSIPIGPAKPNAVNPSEWVTRLEEHGIHMSLEQATALKNRIGNQYAGATAQPYTLGVMIGFSYAYSDNHVNKILFMPYYVGLEPTFRRHLSTDYYLFAYGQNTSVSPYYVYDINLQTMEVGNFSTSISGGNTSIPYQNYMFTLGAQQQTTSISAMSTSASASITAETQIPITANSEVVDGQVDRTKSIVINLPSINPYPAYDPSQIAEVLRELGVVPASETQDATETVTQLREEAVAKYGDTSDYALDLTRYFPFCLPFDIARILQAFVAEPEAPKFSYTIENPFSDDEEDNIVLEIDLAMFDEVASILRTLECILFVVGLAVVTRSLYLRG